MEESFDESSSSSEEDVAEKVIKNKRIKKGGKSSGSDAKKPKNKASNFGDIYKVGDSKADIEKHILIGKKDAVVLIKDGTLGIAKYRINQKSEKPSFYYIYELEGVESHKHIQEALGKLIKYKEKQKK